MKSISLLIIDDSADDVALILREFEQDHYTVRTERVEDENSLRTALAREPWDVVVADHAMARLDSIQALRVVREVAPTVPVVIVSGVIGEEVAVQAMKCGASDYVMKSNLRRLVSAVEREVRDAAAQRLRARTESLTFRLGRIIEESSDEVYVIDAETLYVLQASHAAYAHRGVLPERVLHRPFIELMRDGSRRRFEEHVQPLRSGTVEHVAFECEHTRGDGSVYPVETRVHLSRREYPSVFVAVARDITERKRVERERRLLSDVTEVMAASLDWDQTIQALAQFLTRSFASWCVINVLAPDGGGRFTATSTAEGDGAELREAFSEAACPSLERAFGRAPAELVSHVTPQWLATNFTHERQLAVARALGVESVIMVPLRARDRVLGAMMLVAATVHRRFDAHATALAEDLGQRAAMCVDNARLYREAKSAVRAREEFVAVAAHDLRTPLSALSLAMQSLARMVRQRGPVEQIETLLAVVERSVGRVTHLADDLLDMTRLGVGRLTLNLELVDLAEVVREAIDDVNGSPLGPIVMHSYVGDALIGRWDRKRLDQLLANLLSNAVKYGQGKPVEVELRGDDESASVMIRDHGIGISTESQRRIFQRFERATTERAGLGLGLYIAHEIASLLGGEILVESTLGEGSTFTLRVPRSGPRLSELSDDARPTVH